jgi:hypothetical protein
VILLAAALACVTSLNAQVTAILNRHPARSPEIAIQNHSAVALTAFAIGMPSVDPDAAPFLFYLDSATDVNSALPLPPNQEYAIPLTTGLRRGQPVDLFQPPIAIAGIFAGGATTGDPALLSRLLSRRGSMLQAVELTREILSDAGSRNVPRRQLIEQFRQLDVSLDHWYLPPEQQVGRALYQSIAAKLLNLPQVRFGAPFPPSAFVEQELAWLNRRRTLLMESKPGLRSAR